MSDRPTRRGFMKHPTLIENLGKIRKNDRGHDYGKFQCPFCPNPFVARISKVVNEHTTSCGCRKRKNFKMKLERQIKAKTTKEQRIKMYGEYRDNGADKAYLCKKFGIRASEYSVALQIAEEEFYQPLEVPGHAPSKVMLPGSACVSKAVAPVIHEAPVRSRMAIEQPTASIRSSVCSTNQKAANVTTEGARSTNAYPADTLLRNVPFAQTEEGFNATGEYFSEFRQMPPENFDLKAYWEKKRADERAAYHARWKVRIQSSPANVNQEL